MSGALSLLAASAAGVANPSSGGTFTVIVGLGTNATGGGTQTNWAYGWSIVGYTPGSGPVFNTQFIDNTQCPVGSATAPVLGVTVLGIYSAGGSSGNASYYVILTDGDTTVTAPNFATTLVVDGTTVSGGSTVRATPQYRSGSLIGSGTSRPCTQYMFTLAAPAATLFGTTGGAVKTVVIG
jgi:hypothetical protein